MLILILIYTSRVSVTRPSWGNIHVFTDLLKKFTFITDYPYFICIFSCLQSQVGKPAHSVGHSAFSRQSSFSIPVNINLIVYIRDLLFPPSPRTCPTTPVQHPLQGYFSTTFVNIDLELVEKLQADWGHSLVSDFHSCLVMLVPSAVTVNYRGNVGREANPPPVPTLR